MNTEIEINYTKRLLYITNLDEDEKSFAAKLKAQEDPYLHCGLLEETIVIGDSKEEAMQSFIMEAVHLGHSVNPFKDEVSPFD